MSVQPQARAIALAWLAVLGFGAAGYATIVVPAEREIHTTSLEATNVYELAERNERMLQRGIAIAAAASRVRRDIAELRGKSAVGKPTLELLAFLDDESRRRQVSFGGIVPVERSGTNSGVQRVALSLNGDYNDILHVVSELTTQKAVVGVDSVQLSRDSHLVENTRLDASISATLFYGSGPFRGLRNGEEATSVRTTQR